MTPTGMRFGSFQGHYRIWRLACMSGRILQVMKHFVPEEHYCAAQDADKKKLLFLFKGLSVDFVQSDKQEKRRRVCISAAPTADHILWQLPDFMRTVTLYKRWTSEDIGIVDPNRGFIYFDRGEPRT